MLILGLLSKKVYFEHDIYKLEWIQCDVLFLSNSKASVSLWENLYNEKAGLHTYSGLYFPLYTGTLHGYKKLAIDTVKWEISVVI